MAWICPHSAVGLVCLLVVAVAQPLASEDPAPGPPPRRRVQIVVDPAGGRVVLDGEPVRWFGTTLMLAPGPHRIAIDVPGSRCCWPQQATVDVRPRPEAVPDAVQRLVFRLKLRPAQAVLVGGPCRAVYSCPGIGLVGAARRIDEVSLPSAQWSGSCEFAPVTRGPTRTATVVLHAGELNAVHWPSNAKATWHDDGRRCTDRRSAP